MGSQGPNIVIFQIAARKDAKSQWEEELGVLTKQRNVVCLRRGEGIRLIEWTVFVILVSVRLSKKCLLNAYHVPNIM